MFKRLMIVMILFFGSSIALNAQGLLSKKEKAELTEQIKRDYAKLQLSKQQKVMYHKITIDHAREIKVVRTELKSKYQKINKLKRVQKRKNKSVKQLLTKKQFKVYKKIQQRRKKTAVARYKARVNT